MAAQGQALALNSDVPQDPPGRRWPSSAAGTPAAGLGSAGAYRKCDSFSDFWKAYVAVLLEETHRSVDKGDRAHGALVQNPVPVLRASSARPSPSPRKTGGTKPRVAPLVHRRVQPLMLRVARIGA